MPVAIDRDKTWDYVLEEDRLVPDPEKPGETTKNPKPTVFTLGALTLRDRQMIKDKSITFDQEAKHGTLYQGTTELTILRLGLRGCRDFFDADGNEIAFETEPNAKGKGASRTQVTDRFLERLSDKHLAEIAGEIQLRNSLTEDEAKN